MKKNLIVWMLLLSLFLSGCAKKDPATPTEAPLSDGEYYIYYLSADEYSLGKRRYATQTTDPDTLVRELFEQLKTIETGNGSYEAVLPQNVQLLDFKIDGSHISLNVSTEYQQMRVEQEVMARCALVRTLLQIKGEETLGITVAGHALKGADEKIIGALHVSDFVEVIGRDLKQKDLVLYFADESGAYLVPEKRHVVYSSEVSIERLIVEQLIIGPKEEGHQATLPAGVKLLSVTRQDNTCYLYFDDSFLQNNLPVENYIPIYSLVNTLDMQASVSKVEIIIGKNENAQFRNSISLTGGFTRKLEYILQDTPEETGQ